MNITIFLADDHAVVREGLRHLLEAQPNVTVIGEAANGREAVRQIKKLCPNVVVMDIAMPELNGIESLSQFYDDCPKTKTVMLSVYSSSEHIYRALAAGAIGYVLKEAAGQELLAAIQAAHANRRYLSHKIVERDIDEYIRNRHSESPLEKLSHREREVLQLVVEGKSSVSIAHDLYLSPKTVETYRSRLMQKLEIQDIPGLVKFAIRYGLISLDD